MALKKPPHLQCLLYLAAEDKPTAIVLAGHNGHPTLEQLGVNSLGCLAADAAGPEGAHAPVSESVSDRDPAISERA